MTTAIFNRPRSKRLPAAHYRAKATIKACVESGAGIDFMPDAPRFRYTPLADKPLHCGPPSARGSISCGRGNPFKLKNWQPSKLDANPMYSIPLTDTDADEAAAKLTWTTGNPVPLRQLLAERAAARANAAKIAEVCVDLFERQAA